MAEDPQLTQELYDKARNFAKARRRHRTKTALAAVGGAGLGALGADPTSYIDRMLPQAQARNESLEDKARATSALVEDLSDLAKLKASPHTNRQEMLAARQKASESLIKEYLGYKGKGLGATATVAASRNEALIRAHTAGNAQLIEHAKTSLEGYGGTGYQAALSKMAAEYLQSADFAVEGQTVDTQFVRELTQVMTAVAATGGAEGVAGLMAQLDQVGAVTGKSAGVDAVIAAVEEGTPALREAIAKGEAQYMQTVQDSAVQAMVKDPRVLEDLAGGVRTVGGEALGADAVAFLKAFEDGDWDRAMEAAAKDAQAAMEPEMGMARGAAGDLAEKLADVPEGDLTMQGLKNQLMNTEGFQAFMKDNQFGDPDVAFKSLMQMMRDKKRSLKRGDLKKAAEFRKANINLIAEGGKAPEAKEGVAEPASAYAQGTARQDLTQGTGLPAPATPKPATKPPPPPGLGKEAKAKAAREKLWAEFYPDSPQSAM